MMVLKKINVHGDVEGQGQTKSLTPNLTFHWFPFLFAHIMTVLILEVKFIAALSVNFLFLFLVKFSLLLFVC